jgi:hypothetical protein
MKFRMTKVLQFWIDVEYDDVKTRDPGLTKSKRIAEILREFEEAGDVVRHRPTVAEAD